MNRRNKYHDDRTYSFADRHRRNSCRCNLGHHRASKVMNHGMAFTSNSYPRCFVCPRMAYVGDLWSIAEHDPRHQKRHGGCKEVDTRVQPGP